MNAKKRALGKGLNALLGDDYDSVRKPAPKMEYDIKEAGGVFEIPLNQIYENPQQPRKLFDEEKLNELADSIKEQGVIQAITVRMIKAREYQIISGERRWRASKLAGMKSIPAFVRQIEDKQNLELALIENIQRENLNAIEISLSYKQLQDEFDLTIEELGKKVGKNRSTVNNYLRLLKLPDPIQASIRDQEISMGHARALITLDNEADQLFILKQIVEQDLSVREVEKRVKAALQPKEKKSKEKPALPYRYQQVNERLNAKLDSKVQIQRNAKGKGKISLNFKDDEQLDLFIEKLLS
jgi:ParB family chromosome partitioning protein